MTNIYKEIRKDHDLQRAMIKKLSSTSGDTSERKQLFSDLSKELKRHAIAEEKFFYAPIMQDDKTVEKARHSIAEHKELDDLMSSIESSDPSHSSWLQNAKKLEDRLLHHLDEEEQEIFQISGKVLNDSEKINLAEKFAKERVNQMDKH